MIHLARELERERVAVHPIVRTSLDEMMRCPIHHTGVSNHSFRRSWDRCLEKGLDREVVPLLIVQVVANMDLPDANVSEPSTTFSHAHHAPSTPPENLGTMLDKSLLVGKKNSPYPWNEVVLARAVAQ